MGFRYRKSKKLVPGIRFYVGNNSISTSFGKKGKSISVGKRGIFLNIGIPGTGLSFRQRIDSRNTSKSKKSNNTDSETTIKPISTKQRTYSIRYLSIIKYLFGLIVICLVYNFTKINHNPNDRLIILLFYLITTIIIILIFYKPVKKIIKLLFRPNCVGSNQDLAENQAEETTKKVLSDILQNVTNKNPNNS